MQATTLALAARHSSRPPWFVTEYAIDMIALPL
jgi:hypothetical protein